MACRQLDKEAWLWSALLIRAGHQPQQLRRSPRKRGAQVWVLLFPYIDPAPPGVTPPLARVPPPAGMGEGRWPCPTCLAASGGSDLPSDFAKRWLN